jgi:predicted TPR repeat methyltransferase
VLAAAASALRSGGNLIFTVERAGEERPAQPGFFLQHHGRYCHQEDYVRAALRDVGLDVRQLDIVVLRKEMDQPVRGLLVAACYQGGNV